MSDRPSIPKTRTFVGEVVRLFGRGPDLVTADKNVHPYKFLDGLEGKRVRVTVEVLNCNNCSHSKDDCEVMHQVGVLFTEMKCSAWRAKE